MSNLSTEHLVKCIVEKDKYKQTQLYIKELQLQNDSIYNYINQALYNVLVTNNHPPTSKLYALRFFKDVFMSAQFQLIDGLHQNIMKQIIKACQFDKENPDKTKRGCGYMEQVEKRKKENDSQKISYSFVLFSTEIVYVMGQWHSLDQNNEKTDYAVIYEKLKKAKVPFPANDKELKFFKPEQKDVFMKNYKEWVQKLPQIEQESQEYDEKENMNIRSRKSIKSKQKIPEPPQQAKKDVIKKQNQAALLVSKDQNKESQNKEKSKQAQKIKTTESDVKRLKDLNQSQQKQLNLMQVRIQELVKQNKVKEEKIQQLQITIKTSIQEIQSESKKSEENLKAKYVQLQVKYFDLEKKDSILQKDHNHLKTQFSETESLKEKYAIQNQQQKLILKKIQNQKFQIEEKYKTNIEHVNCQLKEAYQKIKRLQRQIDQLNTIKKSYKKIMEQDVSLNHLKSPSLNGNSHQKAKPENGSSEQKGKIEELEKQIQQIVEFYTKQVISLKAQIKDFTSTTEDLQKTLQTKGKLIQSVNLQLSEKCHKINELEERINQFQLKNQQECEKQKEETIVGYTSEITAKPAQKLTQTTQKREWPVQLDLNEIKPELKTQFMPNRQNSMSDYLRSEFNLNKITHSKEQKSQISTSFQNIRVCLKQKVKNKSLGKTEKSQQKVKQRKHRYSAGKTFHVSSNDPKRSQQFIDLNSYNFSRLSLALNKKDQSKSYNNLWKVPIRSQNNYLQQQNRQPQLSKKSSALLLQRKSSYQQQQSPKSNVVQTMIPFIETYFTSKSSMTHQDSLIFRSLCLFSHLREKQPILVDKVIQVKLYPSSVGSKEVYVLQVMNVSYTAIKVKALSCHDQFRILGDKTRLVHSNSIVEYQVQTRNKDLNLRYPVISLIVTQEENNKSKSLTYNVPLPLTLLEFTEMRNQVPQFYYLNTCRLKVLKSERFFINPKFASLRECFPQLSFSQKNRSLRMEHNQKETIWQGNLLHTFIENVDTYFKITQVGKQISLEFSFRDYDQISEDYAKVMIQTLMFLLQ